MQTISSRINPEFVGIAKEYFEHKKKRLAYEERRLKMETTFNYVSKMNETLSKSLEKKMNELKRLKEIQQRHEDDIRRKNEANQRRREQIEALRKKSIQSRTINRQNIQKARENLHERNALQKQQMKNKLSALERSFRKQIHRRLSLKHKQYTTIRQLKLNGEEKINNFYKQKNRQSYEYYLSMIENEDNVKDSHQKQLARLKLSLNQYNKTVQTRKLKLDQVQQQIQKYNPFRITTSKVRSKTNLPTQQRSIEHDLDANVDLTNEFQEL